MCPLLSSWIRHFFYPVYYYIKHATAIWRTVGQAVLVEEVLEGRNGVNGFGVRTSTDSNNYIKDPNSQLIQT